MVDFSVSKQKSPKNHSFLVYLKIIHYLCSRNDSRWGMWAGMSAIHPTRIFQRHNKRRLFALVLVNRNLANFRPQSKRAINAPWYVFFVVLHNDGHIGVGIRCLFLVKGFARTSIERISKKRFHAFSIFIPMGGLEPTSRK